MIPHGARREEPVGGDLCVCLDVVNVRTVASARVHQFSRVVAACAADDNDDVTVARQRDRRILALLGGLTDRIDKSDIRGRKARPDERDETSHLVERLRRLRRDADARTLVERQHVGLVDDDIVIVEVFGQSANLDVGALADDDRMIAVAPQRLDRLMRRADERTRGFHDLEAERTNARQRPL